MTQNLTPRSCTRGLDITAFIFSIFVPVIGLVLGLVGIHEAHKARYKASGLSVAAVVISLVLIIVTLVVILAVALAASNQPDQYQQYVNCMNSAVPQNC